MITINGKKYECRRNNNAKKSACDLCDLHKQEDCLYGVWACIDISWHNYFKEVKEE